MSIYNKRYNAHFSKEEGKPGVSTYFDTWEEFADLVRFYAPGAQCWWVSEGYGEESDGPNDTICTTRRTIGLVPDETWKPIAEQALA